MADANINTGPLDPLEAENLALIQSSGLFDAAWYKSRYQDAETSGLPPILHYIREGAARGHAPSPGFDGADFAARHKLAAGTNPLVHFIASGRKLAVKPADLEEVQARQIARSGFFDERWYMARHGEAVKASGLTPARHFLRFALEQKLSPGPKFDAPAYLASYPGAAAEGGNPLLHYLREGRAAGLAISPETSPEPAAPAGRPDQAEPKDPAAALAPRDAKEAEKVDLITGSGLFDSGWYAETYPDVAASGLLPVLHYLRAGAAKGYSPSPRFDAAFYLAQNSDVAQSKVNPLLHYINHGQHENRNIKPVDVPAAGGEAKPGAGRSPKKKLARQDQADRPAHPPSTADLSSVPPAEALAIITESPLFDAAWYLAKYPEAARSGLSAAEHYLQSGAAELRQPSLYFDPQFYVIEQSPEIQFTGTNPLLHYIMIGRALGRKPRALFDFTPSPGMEKPLAEDVWPLAVASQAAAPSAPGWKSFDELSAAPGMPAIRLSGLAIVCGASADHLSLHLQRAMAFAVLMGLDPASAVSYDAGGVRNWPVPAGASLDGLAAAGSELLQGRHRLADLWYSAGNTLRFRLGDGAPEAAPPAVLRVFGIQDSAPPAPVLLAEALLPGESTSFIDVRLANPLMPLFVVLSDTAGETIDSAVLPFPSLCRGGLHHAELAGAESVLDPMVGLAALSARAVINLAAARNAENGFLVSAIAADLAGATGSEPLFQPSMRAWLSAVFGLGLKPAEAAQPLNPGESWLRDQLAPGQSAAARKGYAELALPADAVPTIASLTAPAPAVSGARSIGSYFVADPVNFRPRLSVTLPPSGDDLLAVQPGWSPRSFPLLQPGTDSPAQQPLVLPFHVAIRLPRNYESNRSLALLPKAPDARGPVLPLAAEQADTAIDAYVRVTDPARLRTFLTLLFAQRGVSIEAVTAEIVGGQAAAAGISALLDELAPGRGTVVTRQRPAPLSRLTCRGAGGRSPCTLIASDTVILHDQRTLATLAALLAATASASVSCMALREAQAKRGSLLKFESGGLFPSHVSFFASPRLILAEPDLRGAFGTATYPVLANGPGFLLAKTDELERHGDVNDPPDGLGFALRAAAGGFRHYCTGSVRAVFAGKENPIEVNDPPGLECFGPQHWTAILATAAMVREIA